MEEARENNPIPGADSDINAKNISRDILNEIKEKLVDAVWKEFELKFTSAHTDFLKNLLADYPDLTPGDLKLCALLRLNLPSKEIATMMNYTVPSIEVARSRVRKKMGLTTEENLVNKLMAY